MVTTASLCSPLRFPPSLLIAWQIFFGIPRIEEERALQEAQLAQTETPPGDSSVPTVAESGDSTVPSLPGSESEITGTRESVIAATARVIIDTPKLDGSII